MIRYFQILIIILFTQLSAYAQNIYRLSPDLFQKSLRSQESKQLLDIRDFSSFNKGHIKHAINIDYEADSFEKLADTYFKKNYPLYLYGGSNEASNNAKVFLQDLGYSEIYTLEGGFSEWVYKSKPYISQSEDFEPIAAHTPENFKRTIASNPNVFVFLRSPTCSYCKKMESYIHILAKNNNVRLLKIDISQDQNMAEFFDAHETPTLLFYRNKNQVWKNVGALPEQELSRLMNNYF